MLQAQHVAFQKLADFQAIASLLNKSKIPVIPLQGTALLLTVYADMPCRLMRDTDILIHKKDLTPAEYQFRRDSYWPHSSNWTGFSSRYRWRDQLFPADPYGSCSFNKGRIEVDVHFNPHYYVGGAAISLNAEDFWGRASHSPEISSNVWQLAKTDLFDVVLLHALDFHTPTLLQFFDLALMMRRFQIGFDHILKKNLPDIPSDKRPSLNHFLKMLEEIFFSEQDTFSDSTMKIFSDMLLIHQGIAAEKGVPPKKKSPWNYFLELKDTKQKLAFVAGYFLPNPAYYAPDSGLKMHLRHWMELAANFGRNLLGRRKNK
jgi:hypothetical protein